MPPPGPPEPAKGSSVFDRWLADTGRKPDRPPPVRYTSRTRRGRPSQPASSAHRSLSLVWPDGRHLDVDRGASATSLFSFASGNGSAADAVRHRDVVSFCSDQNRDDGNDDRGGAETDYEDDEDAGMAGIVCPNDWREHIETMLDMGYTHYNVCGCTGGMPTDADIEHFAALLREIVASRPELGPVESIGGYPETYVVTAARQRQQPHSE